MLTIVETPLFQGLWPDYWSEDERGEFASWLAHSPDAGDVVPGSGGEMWSKSTWKFDDKLGLSIAYAKGKCRRLLHRVVGSIIAR